MTTTYNCDTAKPARRQYHQPSSLSKHRSFTGGWRDTRYTTLINDRILIRKFIESGRNLL